MVGLFGKKNGAVVVEPLIQKQCWSKWTFFLSRNQALQNISYWPQKSIPSIVFQTRKYKLRGDTGHISIPGSSSSLYIWNQPHSCQYIREIDPWFQIYRELDEGICLKQIQRVVFLFKEIDMYVCQFWHPILKPTFLNTNNPHPSDFQKQENIWKPLKYIYITRLKTLTFHQKNGWIMLNLPSWYISLVSSWLSSPTGIRMDMF